MDCLSGFVPYSPDSRYPCIDKGEMFAKRGDEFSRRSAKATSSISLSKCERIQLDAMIYFTHRYCRHTNALFYA